MMNTVANKPAFGSIEGLTYIKSDPNNPRATEHFQRELGKQKLQLPENISKDFIVSNQKAAEIVYNIAESARKANKYGNKEIDPNKILAANAGTVIDLNA